MAEKIVFDEWVRSHQTAKGLRNKPFPYYEELGTVFGRDCANGQGAMGFSEMVEEIGNEDDQHNDDDPFYPSDELNGNVNISSTNIPLTQSSKKGKKRSRNENLIVDFLKDSVKEFGNMQTATSDSIRRLADCFQFEADGATRRLKMSTEETTSAPSSSVNEKGSKKRKGRGPNKVDLNKISKVKEDGIPFNNLGQPIGKTSVPLSTSYGAVVTQLVPITYESWPKVPDVLKNSLWKTTKREAKLAKNEDPNEVDRVETWIAAHKHKDGAPVNENFGETIEKMEGIATDGPKTIRNDDVAQVSQTGASTSQIGDSQRNSNKYKLLHWIRSGEVVAEAKIDCTDPTALVHHIILGPYC
ncbi:hypothetical protein EZV62_004999 [Acer yangbiense]|uniref:Uncharacterized protein n=1 Tax=Acer yangbiense TaxID=1000413 RepID=A0A5C7IMK9_9ROSI|nr:hypothetical protein EZV62_004999 [Acer yangbiense]